MKRLFIFALALHSDIASAHLVSARFGEFYSGLLHPLSTLVHLVPWIALGLLAGVQGQRHAKLNIWFFLAAIFLGVLLGSFIPTVSWVSVINLLSFIVAGGLLLTNVKIPLTQFLVFSVVIGLFHGVANGVDSLTGGPLLLYLAGVMLAAYIIMTITAALSYDVVKQKAWGLVAVRSVGSWVIAIGLIANGYVLFIA